MFPGCDSGAVDSGGLVDHIRDSQASSRDEYDVSSEETGCLSDALFYLFFSYISSEPLCVTWIHVVLDSVHQLIKNSSSI